MKVVWLPEAEKTFLKNITYLEAEWNATVITNFVEKTDEAIDVILWDPLESTCRHASLSIL